ncbi:MAG: ABC transporter substrate-binding protein [Candidatus Bipolaricaulota bacterium]
MTSNGWLRHTRFGVLLASLLLVVGFVAAADHTGAWVDEVIIVEEPSSGAAVRQLEVGDLDVFAFSISDPDLYDRALEHPELRTFTSFGSYNELTLNTWGPTFEDGRLNPFYSPRIREAMNWLVNRDYIAGDIMGGLAIPRYLPITGAFPDYERHEDVISQIEDEYAHNPEKATRVIAEEMEELGAVEIDGVWHYEGDPVEVRVLIRTEDERKNIGDYVADLLEDQGFAVERLYRTMAEASPYWYSAHPREGKMSVYTGGWVTTVVSRDQAGNFGFFYTDLGLPVPLWQTLENDPEFYEAAERLYRRDFNTLEERAELMETALRLSMEDSHRVWLVDRTGFSPYRHDVGVAGDLAGGIYGAWMWASTIHFHDEGEPQVGGSMTIGMPQILVEPWNPIAGSNTVYDMMPIRGTANLGYAWDPTDGLHWPWMFDRAEVYVPDELPVGTTLDWCELNFVEDTNPVPDDAWADWDAEEQRFITAAERAESDEDYEQTAVRKTVVYYPDDLYDVPLHDGSTISLADFIMGMILTFDRAKEESPIYDEAAVSDFESFMKSFKGVRIISEDPLVIEHYTDSWYLDAEWYVGSWFPYFAQGPGFWHTLTLGILAEEQRELAFSTSKSDTLGVEWMSYIAGPSLEVLHENLVEALETNYIPYEPTLGEYVTEAEALERWVNLDSWYRDKGHFWVASGPFYLEEAHTIEKVVELGRFEDYPQDAERWMHFVVED